LSLVGVKQRQVSIRLHLLHIQLLFALPVYEVALFVGEPAHFSDGPAQLVNEAFAILALEDDFVPVFVPIKDTSDIVGTEVVALSVEWRRQVLSLIQLSVVEYFVARLLLEDVSGGWVHHEASFVHRVSLPIPPTGSALDQVVLGWLFRLFLGLRVCRFR